MPRHPASAASAPLILWTAALFDPEVCGAILPIRPSAVPSSAGASARPFYHPPTAAARSSPLFASSPSSDEISSPAGGRRRRPRAVVVGGGPVGLASALVLSNPPHTYDVAVYETTSGDASTMSYDPTKAFLYNVNERGMTLTRQFPSVQSKLEARGVPMTGTVGIVVVPGDPDEAIPEPKPISMSGPAKGSVSEGDEEEEEEGGAAAAATSYWIPRHDMVKLLYECVLEHNDDSDDGKGRIEYVAGMECVGVRPVKADGGGGDGDDDGEEVMEVTVRDASTGETRTVEGDLVIGADGWKSAVRECLLNGEKNFAHWPKFDHRRFRVKQWISPASGLKIKVLQFPPKFKIPNADGLPPLTTKSTNFYAIRSVNTGPFDYVSFGLLPMVDDTAVRAINVITRPNHQLWGLCTGEEAREWFQKAFPRLPFGKDDDDDALVSPEEWERFATSEGTAFPPCQVSSGLAAYDGGGKCGVALVGDAAHAFPPDVGQGINSGLTDVVWLDRAMRGVDLITGEEKEEGDAAPSPPANLAEALGKYQKERGPEVEALVKYSRIGSPYQYNQPLRLDKVGKALWTANFALRLLLNKLTFGLFPKGAIFMAMDADVPFRRLMRKADVATAGLWSAAAFVMWRALRNIRAVGRLVQAAKGAVGL